MQTDTNAEVEKKRFYYSLVVPFLVVLLMFLSFVLERGMEWNFVKAGLYPQRIENLWGIFTMVFVHADWRHLFNNAISFFVLSSALYYFYSSLATRILIMSYIFSGLILWFIGRESWHIGASGLVYALAFFLFVSGILRKYAPLIAISLIVVFLYGNIVWGIFPWQEHQRISWEGHLAGAIVGFVLAIVYRKKGPQKPVKVWEEEDEEDSPLNPPQGDFWEVEESTESRKNNLIKF